SLPGIILIKLLLLDGRAPSSVLQAVKPKNTTKQYVYRCLIILTEA
ncbi:MAG: hypothetical protein ACI9K1_001985, partial [Arcticibacterium sp.]